MSDDVNARLERIAADVKAQLERVAEGVERRLIKLESVVENGRFVRRETYESDQRAQEKTDIAQERRYVELRDDMSAEIQRLREDSQWLRRSLIGLLFTIIAAATIAALAVGSVA